jgi:hypothetical protein
VPLTERTSPVPDPPQQDLASSPSLAWEPHPGSEPLSLIADFADSAREVDLMDVQKSMFDPFEQAEQAFHHQTA